MALALAIAFAFAFIDEPLRRRLEARVNAQLTGYTVKIGELDLEPLGFAVTLKDVTTVQNAHPNPPVASLPRWRTSLQWRALLSGALVGDVEFDRPEIHLTQRQGRAEAADPTPVEERGWQDAVEAVYPLRINALRIRNGSLTYVDSSKLPPIRLRNLDVLVQDIRNVRSVAGRFPSPFSGHGTLQGPGQLRVNGRADFMAKPTVAVRTRFDVRNLPIASVHPVTHHYNVDMRGGVLTTTGRVEVARGRTLVDIDDLELRRARVDYVHRAATAGAEERRTEKVARVATTPKGRPTTRITIDRAEIADGEFGYVDRSADPEYRLFLTGVRLDLRDFSNESAERTGNAELKGSFMNSGPARLDVSFAPAARQSDFALDLEVRDVDLRTLNDLLRARGGFDVNAGRFSVYSEIDVSNGRIEGYVKPLFADMDVYDSRQDAEKGPFRKLYEGLVGGVSQLLENRKRNEVATVADVSGPIENPNSSTLEIVIRLVQNAFVKAILPGLERERDEGRRTTG